MTDLMTTERVIPTIASPPQTDSAEETDPYLYGWRHVSHTLPNGKQVWQRVPLTLEDILHPQEGDFRVHSDEHQRFCDYLYDVLTALFADDPSAIVLHDVRVRWDVPALEPHGPDIAVMLGVSSRKDWGTFDVKEERAKPLLVIEVTSPKTRKLDLDDKVSQYHQAAVPYYVIVDRAKGKKRTKRRLLGYHFTPFGYSDMKTNDLGWLWLEPVKIWIGFRGRQLVCVDESGKLIPDHKGTVAKLKKAEVQAEVAKAQAQVERTQRLTAETKAQVERRQRLTAETKAQAAKAQAQVERRQRLTAETKAQAAETKAQAAEARAQAERKQRLAMEEELERLRAKFASIAAQTDASEQNDD